MSPKESNVMPIAAIVAMLMATLLIAGLVYLAGEVLIPWDTAFAIGTSLEVSAREQGRPEAPSVTMVAAPSGGDAPGGNDGQRRVRRAVEDGSPGLPLVRLTRELQ